MLISRQASRRKLVEREKKITDEDVETNTFLRKNH